MNLPLCDALDPIGFALSRRDTGTGLRERQRAQWRRIHGGGVEPPPRRMLAEHPLVASARLQAALDRRVDEIVAFVRAALPRMRATIDGWPHLGAPDVVCADLAIVVDPAQPGGWGLSWVEFQAFTSIVATMHTLHLGAGAIWPEVRDWSAWSLPAGARDWFAALRAWSARADGIVLEWAPERQLSRFDLQAASRMFDLPLVDPRRLARDGRTLAYRDADGTARAVRHVFNRLVMHELDDRDAFIRTAAQAEVSWHSHPAWYYGMSKAWLPALTRGGPAPCAFAPDWRALGLPAAALVAKDANSHGGVGVRLNVDASALDALGAGWIVQPRYTPQPLFLARDGHPVTGEIRCIIALPEGQAPWLACQLIRLSRDAKSSASHLGDLPGSGATLLYRPPARAGG